jgi:hypothetical protein
MTSVSVLLTKPLTPLSALLLLRLLDERSELCM